MKGTVSSLMKGTVASLMKEMMVERRSYVLSYTREEGIGSNSQEF